jgi:hypothetical protein
MDSCNSGFAMRRDRENTFAILSLQKISRKNAGLMKMTTRFVKVVGYELKSQDVRKIFRTREGDLLFPTSKQLYWITAQLDMQVILL